MSTRYDDFDLVFRKQGDGYAVQLINSPTGQAEGEFTLPFTDGEMRRFYDRIGQLNRRTRRADSPDMAAAKQFGGKLFDSVFQGELLGRLRASVDPLRGTNRGLRLRLRLKDAPALAELPWEFLYDREQDHFLATSTLTPMVRYLDMASRVSALKVHLPLRILVVIAGPANLQRLDAEGEWDRLKVALAELERSGTIVLERLPQGTLDALRRRAARDSFHILHFVGHGSFDAMAGDGCLHFEDEKGMSDPVPGSLLGNILRDHGSLRLVVLNACEGARQSTEDPFSGVAQSLCQQQIPAVIAMQFEISDDAAKRFAEEFYLAISDCAPVDAAVAASRKSMFNGRFGQEWATPVLYMRSPDGLLFDVQKKRLHPAIAVMTVDPRKQEEAARAAAAAEAMAIAEAEKERQERERQAEAEQRRQAQAAEVEKQRQQEEQAEAAKAKAAEAAEARRIYQAIADEAPRRAAEMTEAQKRFQALAARVSAEAEQKRLAEHNAAELAAVQASVEAERKPQIESTERELAAVERNLANVLPPPKPPEGRPVVLVEEKRGTGQLREIARGAMQNGAAAARVPVAAALTAGEVRKTPLQALVLAAIVATCCFLAFCWGVFVAMTTRGGVGGLLFGGLLLSAAAGVALRYTAKAANARWLVWVYLPIFLVGFVASREGIDSSIGVGFLSMFETYAIAVAKWKKAK